MSPFDFADREAAENLSMKRQNSTRLKLRNFYTDHLAAPIEYGILTAVLGSIVFLLMTWAGWRGRLQP